MSVLRNDGKYKAAFFVNLANSVDFVRNLLFRQ
jgi:hypothetical protein